MGNRILMGKPLDHVDILQLNLVKKIKGFNKMSVLFYMSWVWYCYKLQTTFSYQISFIEIQTVRRMTWQIFNPNHVTIVWFFYILRSFGHQFIPQMQAHYYTRSLSPEV